MSNSDAAYFSFDEYHARLAKLKQLQEAGINPYPSKYHPSMSLGAVSGNWEHDPVGDFEAAIENRTPKLKLIGRLVLMRAMGKNVFAHIQDDTGRVQVLFGRDFTKLEGYQGTEEASASKFIEKKFDLGDFVGVEGSLFRTQKGELTLLVEQATMLCKSLLPLPDKHAGLTDKQVRYRKRWLDLISHSDVVNTFKTRSRLLREIRSYFHENDFMEVETPILQNNYGGAQARPFISHLNALSQDMFLRISLEIPLKKLLVGGLPRIFEIGKVFRNEGIDRTHNPEFTMVEAYSSCWDYEDMMKFVENLLERLTKSLFGSTQVAYEDKIIDFKAPWKRLSMVEAIETLARIPVTGQSNEALAQTLIDKAGMAPEEAKKLPRGLLIANLFEEFAESHLIQPTHIIDHPIETTPLCKLHRDPKLRQEGFVERFESFVLGGELCNAYSELNDPLLQRKLLEEQAQAKLAGDEEAHPMDEEFLEAICQGMPPAGGVGIGIDRLVMLMTGCHSIRDVLYFPLMKPENHEASEEPRS
jgi:lysyl-tRNA synthetase class 2